MSGMFPATPRMAVGYQPDQVEEFFTRARRAYEAGAIADARTVPDAAGTDAPDGDPETISELEVRTVAFDLVRAGYDTTAVDSALDRLEAAIVQRRRDTYIAEHGEKSWLEGTAELATSLYPRLVRPSGERFAPPEGGRGYERSAVDAVMDRLIAYFDAGGELSAAELRGVTFPVARAADAYAEGVVDAYLDRAVEVLLAVE